MKRKKKKEGGKKKKVLKIKQNKINTGFLGLVFVWLFDSHASRIPLIEVSPKISRVHGGIAKKIEYARA